MTGVGWESETSGRVNVKYESQVWHLERDCTRFSFFSITTKLRYSRGSPSQWMSNFFILISEAPLKSLRRLLIMTKEQTKHQVQQQHSSHSYTFLPIEIALSPQLFNSLWVYSIPTPCAIFYRASVMGGVHFPRPGNCIEKQSQCDVMTHLAFTWEFTRVFPAPSAST